MKRVALLVILVACKGKPARHDEPAPAPVRDAATLHDAGVRPELKDLPNVDPVRVINLPAKATAPRFTVGGPVIAGDLAIVASSQFGFLAVDYHRGQIVWSKPSGAHVAPPVITGGNVILIGDCVAPPDVSDGDTLLGCARVVTPSGADQAYVAIHGKTVGEFAAPDGAQAVWPGGANDVIWRRGDKAVTVDLISGAAKPAAADDPPLVITYKDRTWRIRRTEEGQLAADGNPSWQTKQTYGRLLGAVYIPGQSPLVRVSRATRHGDRPEMMLLDIDATGSLNDQVSIYPVPGIGLIGHAIDPVGNVALAVRLDTSLERDYIAAYATNALLLWTYPLPQVKRADPVGVAVAPDAVVVFHDGDQLTVLPELSAPPTAPGAARPPSDFTTP